MIKNDINDKIVLFYHVQNTDKNKSIKPIGTGFFINEKGHIITAYHIVKDSLRDIENLKCKWHDIFYDVEKIDEIADFYQALKTNTIRIDLIILRIKIPNINFKVNHFSIFPRDINSSIPQLTDVYFYGFDIENTSGPDNLGNPLLIPNKGSLSKYDPTNGTWRFKNSNKDVFKGFSGSPVFERTTNEVISVVIHKGKHQYGLAQSLHMLFQELHKFCYETFFPNIANCLPYSIYTQSQIKEFEEEIWPYEIDQEVFVNIFDYTVGSLKTPQKHIKDNERCISFIKRTLEKQSVLCVAFYGMGKTTISKHLFTQYVANKHDILPIYISLSGIVINNFSSANFEKHIIEEVILGLDGVKKHFQSSLETMRQMLIDYFKFLFLNNKIVFLLDGIDESIYSRESLFKFAKILTESKHNFLLTVRKEFTVFFDTCRSKLDNISHVLLELNPWYEKQWDEYVKNLGAKFPEKNEKIINIKRLLMKRAYGELPSRPIFLKMISDLELNIDASIKIPDELKKNKAAIFYNYINWKIEDDYERKGGIFKIDRGQYFLESFELFGKLAILEYSDSLPPNILTDFIGGPSVNKEEQYENYSGFNLQNILRVCSDFSILNPKFIRDNLLETTFFSIISRSNNYFKFSHKSFLEYLFSYDLAHNIFTNSSPTEATCGDTWNFYQTYEVSSHFQDEVKRLCYEKDYSVEVRNLYLKNAFEKMLMTQTDSYEVYSEIVEEVIYYTGKYKIESDLITKILKKMIINPERVHPIYYRTAHLSLSMIDSVDYGIRYVEYLVDNYQYGNKKDYELNRDIQNFYYGESNLHNRLKTDIDIFIVEENLIGLLPIKIFSYFMSLQFSNEEKGGVFEYIKTIRDICFKKKYESMMKLVDKICVIIEHKSKLN